MGLEKPVIAKLLLCVIKATHTWGLLVAATAATAVLQGAQPSTGLILVGSGEHRFSGGV